MSQFDKISILNSIEDDIEEIMIMKDGKLRQKILNQLIDVLVNAYDDQRKEAVDACIKYLLQFDDDTFTEEHAKKINSILKKHLSKDLAELVDTPLENFHRKLYRLGISDVASATKLKLSFKLADKNVASILKNQTMYWILNYYSDNLNKKMDELMEPYFSSDRNIREITSDFAEKFVEYSNRGFAYFEGLAGHTTYRTGALGYVTGMEKAGIESYEIKVIMDDRTSAICRNMNGRIFKVSTAIKFREKILTLKSKPDIKKFAPWRPETDVIGVDTEELPLGMALPPYHWQCRTTIIAHF